MLHHRFRPSALLALLVSLALLTACSQVREGPPASGFDEVWLQPQADWGGYRGVALAPVEVRFADEDSIALTGSRLGASAQAAAALRARIAADWDARIRAALVANGLNVVDPAAAGAIELTASIDEVVLMPAFDDTALPTRTYARQTARARLDLTVRDLDSGQTLLRIRDRDGSRDEVDLRPRSAAEARSDLDALLGRWAEAAVRLMRS